MNIQIGELAKRAECPVVTIRFYENEGLLPLPKRSKSNYRIYTESDINRLQFIRHCRSLNMSLDEIKVLLNYKDYPCKECSEVNELLDRHIHQVVLTIQAQIKLKEQLISLRQRCTGAQTAGSCGVLIELSHNLTATKKSQFSS